MAKLTGAKKIAFLTRLNKGRRKKGLTLLKIKKNPKRRITLPKTRKTAKIRPKSRRKTPKKVRNANKRKPSRNNKNMAKKKNRTSRRSLGMTKVKQGAVGGVVGIATTAIAKRLGANSIADDLGYVTASLAGKGTPGVIGNAVIRQGLGRFGGSLNILNGNGNGQTTNTVGFA